MIYPEDFLGFHRYEFDYLKHCTVPENNDFLGRKLGEGEGRGY